MKREFHRCIQRRPNAIPFVLLALSTFAFCAFAEDTGEDSFVKPVESKPKKEIKPDEASVDTAPAVPSNVTDDPKVPEAGAPKNAEKETPVVWPGLDSEFYLVERKLADRGIARHPDEPLADWLRRALAEPTLKEADKPLRDLLRLHYRYRFDPLGLTGTDREELKRDAQLALGVLEKKPV